MNIIEYEKIKERNYLGYIKYLDSKYWDKEKFDYMTNRFVCTGKGNKADEGLEQHHIKENIAAGLSNPEVAKQYPFNFQKAENLVYCDKLEHMLLHLLIFEETHTGSKMLGIRGILDHMIPDLFIAYSCQNITDKRLLIIRDDKDTFIALFQRLVDDINKFNPEYLDDIIDIRNTAYSSVKEKVVTPDIFEQALPELFKDSFLFDYNIPTYEKAEKLLDTEGACCILMGTGIGKTTTALEYLRTHKCRGLVLCPSNTIKSAWLENREYCDIMTYAQFMNCYRKIDYTKYGCMICDEAHHINEDAKRWAEGVKYVIDNKILPVFGLTATKGKCDKIFGKNNMVKGYDIFQAIREKIIYPVSYVTSLYHTSDNDNDEFIKYKNRYEKDKENRIKSSSASEELLGEINWNLQEISNLVLLVNKTLEQLKKSPKKIIAFCQRADDFEYVKNLMKEIFPKLPIYTMSYKDRAEANINREKFRDCKTGILLAVNMVSEGAHYENVDTLFLFRRTDSDIVYQQQIGRIMTKTTKANPHAVIFDFVNNAQHVKKLMKELIDAYKDSLDKKARRKIEKQISNNGETLKSDQIIIDSKIQSLLNLFDECEEQIKYDNRSWWQDENNEAKKADTKKYMAQYITDNHMKDMISGADIKNKKILIIGNPDSCSFTDEMIKQGSSVTLITSFKNYPVYNNVKIIEVMKTKEAIINAIKELKDMNEKFDLVFANPPYSIGNKIIDETMKVTDNAVVLMPLSKYKGNDLYKKVKSYHLVDPDEFEDAYISINLSIASLDNNYEPEVDYDSFMLVSYDPKFIDFYKLNLKINDENTYKYYCDAWLDEIKDDLSPENTFIVGVRVSQDGVHTTTNCNDYRWNILKQGGKIHTFIQAYSFKNKTAMDNFCNWWYKNPLQNDLIKGMHKDSGSIRAAIPHIDWSKDRDYEHLTYDQLCDILRNED